MVDLRVQLNVQEGEDKFVLDGIPDDAGHLISEDVYDGSGLDLLRHVGELTG